MTGLDQVARDWTALGQADPLWAVLVHPAGKGGRWDVDDFLATGVVLQHLPRAVIDGHVAELLRVLRPGGTAVLQLPTGIRWTPRGVAWRVLPFPVLRWLQRRPTR
jgi:hypothetical protein